jgi:hypothetical protein
MTWTGRQDSVQCCPDSPGAVNDDEAVVRLLHSKNSQPFQETFRTEELLPPKKRAISNVCGDADGFSITRLAGRTDHDIRKAAVDYAAQKADRTSSGALIAKAADLRKIRKTGDLQNQVVYVYDDPTNDDKNHALIRVAEMDRPDFSDVKDKIGSVFSIKLLP